MSTPCDSISSNQRLTSDESCSEFDNNEESDVNTSSNQNIGIDGDDVEDDNSETHEGLFTT